MRFVTRSSSGLLKKRWPRDTQCLQNCFLCWMGNDSVQATPDLMVEGKHHLYPNTRIGPTKTTRVHQTPPQCSGNPKLSKRPRAKGNFSVVYCATLETSAWGYDWLERASPESMPIGSHPSPRCGVWNYTSRTTIPAWIPRGIVGASGPTGISPFRLWYHGGTRDRVCGSESLPSRF